MKIANKFKSPFSSLLRPKLTMMSTAPKVTYNHLEIEPKWQKYWEDHETFKTVRRVGRNKKYVLDMFPYPSGAGLHVGHPEGYTATDIMSRYWRMKGYDVLHPMGWDAFGLPAEQHAINTGTHPAVTTYQNIATFKRQLKSLGFSYDWNRELATTDDNYVRWTQWIFLQLFRHGLATQSEVAVNWCPALGTVLANEEIIDGLSERGSHPVVRQPLRQWILKITDYADKLEEGLQGLDWPEGTLTAQKQWIGRSTGASIRFEVPQSDHNIEVFTTRPDTLLGVTYVVLAPEHPLVSLVTTQEKKNSVESYVIETARKSDLERTSIGKDKGKTGIFTGSYAIHPLNGEPIPIWVADYVLMGYGTGAVMAVPAHDERDFEFAEKFSLSVKRVVQSSRGSDNDKLPMTTPGIACNSGEFDGLTTDEAKAAVICKLSSVKKGDEKIIYKLRDWVFSRQRYWGEPIPIYFPVEMSDPAGDPRKGTPHKILYDKPIPVEDSELPLKLPEMKNFEPGDDPQGCLARAVDWRYFEKDGKWYSRETNTMPQVAEYLLSCLASSEFLLSSRKNMCARHRTFLNYFLFQQWAGSCWYYLRFTDPTNVQSIFNKEASSWLPVDLYVGGQEHAVLHLLYARFWHKVLYDIGIVDHNEPFLKLVHQGMILGSDGEKMSKSRGNVINPDEVVQEHGADALRLYEMFMGPLEAVKPWQTSQLSGVVRFRDRVFSLVTNVSSKKPADGTILKDMHKTIKKVTKDIDALAFNTAISTMMVFTNSLIALGPDAPQEAIEILLRLLSPIAPHVAEEGWSILGHKDSIALEDWPVYDEVLCVDTTATIAIQVNGKMRTTIEMEVGIKESDAIDLAMNEPLVTKYTNNLAIKKVIYVPGKVLNIVVAK